MDAVRNPYSPGAGRRPPALVGRDFQLQAFDVLLHRAAIGKSGQSLILSGLRGVGKTVLLNELAGRAAVAGWITAKVEVTPQDRTATRFATRLARSLHASLRQLQHKGWSGKFRAALGTFKAFTLKLDQSGSLSIGIDVDAARGRADTGNIATDLTELAVDLAEAAAEQHMGLAVFVDELQDADTETLASLVAAAHEAGQRELPFYLVGAGLPSLPRILAEAMSYAERLFDYHTIGYLASPLAQQALVAPAAAEGVSWHPDALNIIAAASAGYPYFLQEYGAAVWNLSPGPVITDQDAGAGQQLGEAKLGMR